MFIDLKENLYTYQLVTEYVQMFNALLGFKAGFGVWE